MIAYDPHNAGNSVYFDVIEPAVKSIRTKIPSSRLSDGSLRQRVKRLWCKVFHNSFQTPIRGKAICNDCLEVWEVGL